MHLISPQLRAFIAVAINKTVHAAAIELSLTQTAITQRIHNLESRLKTSLFVRSRRGMELTQEGEVLLHYCHSVQALEGETLAKIEKFGIQSEIQMRIIAASSIMRSRIIPKLANFKERYPNVLLHCHFDDEENLQSKLRTGEYDFAVMTMNHITADMSGKELLAENYILVCSAAWRHRDLQDIIKTERIIDFGPEDKMSFHYLRNFGWLELANKSRHFINNIDSIAETVAAGMGYTVLTEEFAQKYLSFDRLIALNAAKTYAYQPYLVWYTRPQLPHYFNAFIKEIE